MTEEDAKDWLVTAAHVSRETLERLSLYVTLVADGMATQNLIAESTRPHIWARHIVDSAQLLPLAVADKSGLWVDLGSGAGMPGIVVACMTKRPVLLIESRRKRIDFLNMVIDRLGLTNASVFGGRVETCRATNAAVISARAYASLDRTFATAQHMASSDTLWLLPKGRSAENELATVRPAWQGAFHVEHSVTDGDSAIIVATNVRPASKGYSVA